MATAGAQKERDAHHMLRSEREILPAAFNQVKWELAK